MHREIIFCSEKNFSKRKNKISKVTLLFRSKHDLNVKKVKIKNRAKIDNPIMAIIWIESLDNVYNNTSNFNSNYAISRKSKKKKKRWKKVKHWREKMQLIAFIYQTNEVFIILCILICVKKSFRNKKFLWI